MSGTEIVLITGGSGFLGQHLVRILQEKDDLIKEIRIVDLQPYQNRLGHAETKRIINYIGDICKPETIQDAFKDVDCVFHCAAYINFQYPPNYNELERVNVTGTANVIDLCVKYNISRLIFTSTSAVTLIPYMGRATFAIIVNQVESKAKTPTLDNGFLVPGYPASKLRGEKLVLGANGKQLENGEGVLLTTAIRPPIIYGEEDSWYFPSLIKISEKFNGRIPRIAGAGGKHQIVYAGNVAWSLVRAKDTLKTNPNKIAGLPIFITDDSPIEDTHRFCQRISRNCNSLKLEPTWWSIPAFFTYFISFLLEMIILKFLNPVFNIKLNFPPRGIASYTSSIIMYSRLRAAIHLDYEPIYSEQKSILNSANWYEKWYQEHINEKNWIKR